MAKVNYIKLIIVNLSKAKLNYVELTIAQLSKAKLIISKLN